MKDAMKFRRKNTYLILTQHSQILFDHGAHFQNTYEEIKDINIPWNTLDLWDPFEPYHSMICFFTYEALKD